MTYYVVLKVLTEIEFRNTDTENFWTISNDNIAGFMPVCKTEQQAIKECENGKYKYLAIEINN